MKDVEKKLREILENYTGKCFSFGYTDKYVQKINKLVEEEKDKAMSKHLALVEKFSRSNIYL